MRLQFLLHAEGAAAHYTPELFKGMGLKPGHAMRFSAYLEEVRAEIKPAGANVGGGATGGSSSYSVGSTDEEAIAKTSAQHDKDTTVQEFVRSRRHFLQKWEAFHKENKDALDALAAVMLEK